MIEPKSRQPNDIPLSHALWGLVAIMAVKGFWQYFLCREGFIAVSGDDFLRMLMSHAWSQEPYLVSEEYGFASVLWMPMQMWLMGTLMQIIPDLWTAAISLSFTASMVSIVLLFQITKKVSGNRAGLFAAILAGFLPWQVWLSTSGIASTLFHAFLLCGIYSTMLGWSKGKDSFLWTASVFFLFACMVRPEAWFYAVLFAMLLLIARVSGNPSSPGWITTFCIAALPGVFILSWFLFNYAMFGDPLQFIRFSKESYEFESQGLDSMTLRALKYPLICFIISPFICLALPFAVISTWNHKPARLLLYFAAGGFLLMFFASIFGSGTNTAPQRYMVTSILLAVPFVAAWISGWTRRWISVFVIAVIFCLNLSASYIAKPFEYIGAGKAARALRELVQTGALQPGERIATEGYVRKYLDVDETDRLQEVFLVTDHWALQVMSNHPDRFNQTVWTPYASLGDPEYESLEEYLSQNRIGVIILKDRDLVRHLPDRYRLREAVDGYLIFLEKPEESTSAVSLQNPPLRREEIDTDWGTGFRLSGYTMDAALLPKYVTLFWYADDVPQERYIARLRLVNSGQPDVEYTRSFVPVHEVWPTSRWKEGDAHIERVDLPRPMEFVPGEYDLFVDVRLDDGGGWDQASSVFIGQHMLSARKRAAIRYALLEGKFDPALLLRVFLTL